jgi:tagatose-1,6-bisphosphate aldolase non-catalytic subunit AgaZ/GatZ
VEGLAHAWPCFIVGKVGTDLHTTTFDPESAHRLYERVVPLGSLVKGHYTDWVENPEDYPATGMGGANVGPEFTAAELDALHDLCQREAQMVKQRPDMTLSGFRQALQTAVVDSNRWQKWLIGDEMGREFDALKPDRQEWLVATGARYVWTDPQVLAAREHLYQNLSTEISNPNTYVVDHIAAKIQRYVDAFNLRDSLTMLVD